MISSSHVLLDECLKLLEAKGKDYQNEDDRFANFRIPGLTTRQTWMVYAHKHYCAIQAFCTKGKVESEPIRERIKDMINYLLLLNFMIEEGVS